MGTMYTFRYPLADGSGGFIPVSTTRPETIPGDSAVFVHPEDPRYSSYVGRKVRVRYVLFYCSSFLPSFLHFLVFVMSLSLPLSYPSIYNCLPAFSDTT
jgi:hypothetical protein